MQHPPYTVQYPPIPILRIGGLLYSFINLKKVNNYT